MAVINLRNYLRNVYADLKNNVDGFSDDQRDEFMRKCHKLFKLGEGSYDDNNLVAFYVMKYARAYGFQFSRAYADIFADMGNRDNVRAVSIGCGTGIDYWGMSYAARILQTAADCHLDYTGIDPQDWFYKVTDSFDMPNQDTVRFNEVKCLSDGHMETCSNFGDLLDIMERNEDESLDDIYFFPHSIKEVSVYTAPETQEKIRLQKDSGNRTYVSYAYKYNPYQSMARFARLIKERISDHPVYVAFTYRRSPNEAIEGRMERTEAYDVRYGTYFRTCIKQRGLNIELVEPVQVEAAHGIGLCRKDSSYDCRESFFDYADLHSYTGAPDTENIVGRLGKDRNGSFTGLYYGGHNAPICSREEWDTTFCDSEGHTENTMDSVENMCYQVFKISAEGAEDADIDMLEKNKWLDIIEEVMRGFKFNIQYMSVKLDSFVGQVNSYISVNETSVKDIIERVTGTRPNSVSDLTNKIDLNTIKGYLVDAGYLNAGVDDDGNNTWNVTNRGRKAGFYKTHNLVIVKPFAQQNIVANIICGRYIDWGNRI